jgi:hypothetical protein
LLLEIDQLAKDDGGGTLEPAGAGLPPMELLIAKTLQLPLAFATTSNAQAMKLFLQEARYHVDLVSKLSPEARDRRVLVPKLPLIEDSSRFWSAGMVLEHLIIAGERMGVIIQSLSGGKMPTGMASIADLKPPGKIGGEQIIEEYATFVDRFIKRMNNIEPSVNKRNITYAHPWYGPLGINQWICLSALHQKTHTKQLQAIRSRL